MIPLILIGVLLIMTVSQEGNTSTAVPATDGPATDAVPSRFDGFFQSYGTKYGVNWEWLKAICMNESSLGENPLVIAGQVSTDGKSYGIMQLTIATANDYESVGADELNDPETAVRIASRLMRDIQNHFDASDARYNEWCIKSYNQGRGNTDKEIAGTSPGYAAEYWTRWQRNYAKLTGG